MITYILIAINVVVSLRCFNRQDIFWKLAFIPYQCVHRKEWYRILTHGFVHADSIHLLVNMFTFYSFGTYMEKVFPLFGLSSLAYLGLYFGGMIVASLYDLVAYRDNPNFASIGASGAVSAVLFTSILFDPFGKILFFAILPIPGIVFGVLYLLYCQYMSRQSRDQINHNAHFWGALFGFVYPILLEPQILIHFLSRLGL